MPKNLIRLRTYLSGLALVCLMSSASFATTDRNETPKSEAKVRSAITKLGIGPETNVKVKMRDKRKVKGYVSDIGETDFTVTDRKTGETTTIAYSQVKQIKGKNNLTGEQIAWGVLIAIAIIGIIMLGTD